jgi:hypothetical protein
LTRSSLVPFAIEFLSFAHVELCFDFFFFETGTLSIYATGYLKIVTLSVLIILSDVSIVLQTLSSLALVFALHHYKPTPLYVMDKIDAALGKSCELAFLLILSISKDLYVCFLQTLRMYQLWDIM